MMGILGKRTAAGAALSSEDDLNELIDNILHEEDVGDFDTEVLHPQKKVHCEDFVVGGKSVRRSLFAEDEERVRCEQKLRKFRCAINALETMNYVGSSEDEVLRLAEQKEECERLLGRLRSVVQELEAEVQTLTMREQDTVLKLCTTADMMLRKADVAISGAIRYNLRHHESTRCCTDCRILPPEDNYACAECACHRQRGEKPDPQELNCYTQTVVRDAYFDATQKPFSGPECLVVVNAIRKKLETALDCRLFIEKPEPERGYDWCLDIGGIGKNLLKTMVLSLLSFSPAGCSVQVGFV